jgi:hypothetical protein
MQNVSCVVEGDNVLLTALPSQSNPTGDSGRRLKMRLPLTMILYADRYPNLMKTIAKQTWKKNFVVIFEVEE